MASQGFAACLFTEFTPLLAFERNFQFANGDLRWMELFQLCANQLRGKVRHDLLLLSVISWSVEFPVFQYILEAPHSV
jgi:hypothetical protein